MGLFSKIKKAAKKVSVKNVVKASKAVTKVTYPLANKVSNLAAKVGVPEVRTVLNLKKAITDPMGYAKATTSLVSKASSLTAKVQSGAILFDAQNLLKKKGAEALSSATKQIASVGKIKASDITFEKPQQPEYQSDAPTFSQLTGQDLSPITPAPQKPTIPTTQQFTAPAQPSQAPKSKTPIIAMAAAGGLVLILLVVMVARK